MRSAVAIDLALVHALRTGNVLLDVVLCAVVPMLLEHAQVSLVTKSWSDWVRVFFEWCESVVFGRGYVVHAAEWREQVSMHGSVYTGNMGKDYSPLMVRALAVFVADRVDLSATSARYDLLDTKVDPAPQGDRNAALQASKHDIARLRVRTLPLKNVWMPLEEGLEVQFVQTMPQPSKEHAVCTHTIGYRFRTYRKDGPNRIKNIMTQAVEEYQEIKKRQFGEDTQRYMYVRDLEEPDKGKNDEEKVETKSDAAYHKRYVLCEDKTFVSLFFEGKDQLLSLLDQFETHTGKFAIEGFPYKLGLLMHGPPGTGKTSVIRAIAHQTKRHIVSISLSKIKTNQELMDAMFDLRYAVDGQEAPVRLTFEDVVFVMEDVDCVSDVVAVRSNKATKEVEKHKPAPMTRGDALLVAFLQSNGLIPKSGLVAGSNATDKLNLAGLLNVLDGVVDCPGRILIMTTNHPEKLDPALIRPGRVNKSMYMGPMAPDNLVKMLEYYFATTMSDEQRSRVLKLCKHYSPAQIEEYCAEYDTLEDVIAALGSNAASCEEKCHEQAK